VIPRPFRALQRSSLRIPPVPRRKSIVLWGESTPTTPANLAEVFALGFGTGNLIQNSYRLGHLQDAEANPDGG
jgi:hypothetical protein